VSWAPYLPCPDSGLSLPAFALPDILNVEICPDCVEDQGLCRAERCRRSVLPQPARNPLVRLLGDVRIEQKKRQIVEVLPESPEAKAHKARKKSAQTIARSKRRGYFGLLKAIQDRKRA
jgi:hypothetical protein